MIGLLCPGQGSQLVGMGRDLADRFPIARQTFEEADDALGFALSEVCWSGPEPELTRTENAQPAILVHGVAVWRILQAEHPLEVAIAAGHSLGEFTAHVAAGSIPFVDAVRAVRRRGELMGRAGDSRPGTMIAVLGMEDAALAELCERATAAGDGVVVPANFNSPGQVVLSGDVGAVERAGEMARAAGAKRVIPLNVSGAFHSPLMQAAADGLREVLEGVRLETPAFPVVSNVTAEPVSDVAVIRDLLLRQMTSPVRWTESVAAMAAAGIDRFVEIGPGSVLTGLLRRNAPGATGSALGTVEQIETFLREYA